MGFSTGHTPETAVPAPTKAWALRRVAQILVLGVRERIGGVRVTSRGDVPRSALDITSQWLTEVMCAGTPDGRVRAVTVLAGSDGTTTRSTLAVEYNDVGAAAGLPARVFVKCTSGLAQRLMLGLGGVIDGEPGFYNHVRPLLTIEAPLGYHAAVDAASWRSVVIIEDVVATRGAVFWQPAARVTPERVRVLLCDLAAWHGALWGSGRLADWAWLKTPADQMRVIDALLGLADRTSAGLARARSVIPSGLLRRADDLRPAMRRSMDEASRPPHTYLHGDLHIANTYLTRDNKTGVCDWQVGLRGSWAYDYSYLLATALDIDERRAWEHDLLDFYLERLAAAGVEPIPRARAWQAYRQALFYPYFAWLYTMGRSRLQPSFQPHEVSLMMIERIGAAIADLGSFGAVGL
jgi:hypothetical protein